jgi:hypothetical protein
MCTAVHGDRVGGIDPEENAPNPEQVAGCAHGVISGYSAGTQWVLVGHSWGTHAHLKACSPAAPTACACRGAPTKRPSECSTARPGRCRDAGLELWGRPDFFGVDKALYLSDGWKSSINHLRRYSQYSRYSHCSRCYR